MTGGDYNKAWGALAMAIPEQIFHFNPGLTMALRDVDAAQPATREPDRITYRAATWLATFGFSYGSVEFD